MARAWGQLEGRRGRGRTEVGDGRNGERLRQMFRHVGRGLGFSSASIILIRSQPNGTDHTSAYSAKVKLTDYISR